jgi:Arc/MetJ family transcription regulator
MRTTLNINDDLLKQAAQLSGITEKTAVVHAGLEALVARESAKRLAALGGSEPRLRKIRRRRPQASMASRRTLTPVDVAQAGARTGGGWSDLDSSRIIDARYTMTRQNVK